MATPDPTVTPSSNSTGVVNNEQLQGDLAEGEARAATTVGELDNYVSPSGGDSHIGAIDDRSGDTNSTTGI